MKIKNIIAAALLVLAAPSIATEKPLPVFMGGQVALPNSPAINDDDYPGLIVIVIDTGTDIVDEVLPDVGQGIDDLLGI